MASHVGLPVMKLPLINPAPWPIQTRTDQHGKASDDQADRTRRMWTSSPHSVLLAGDLEQAVVI